ncbi:MULTISPECIES: SapB/AmfS family lanthipeptide [Cellulomonas]|nr:MULTISPECIES: SapB/AmfS family lanthipeptide [Cellulomonas]
MGFVLDLQSFDTESNDAARSIGSTISIALCGSTVSAFWC